MKLLAALILTFAAPPLAAQQPDSAKCDSMLAAAKIGDVETGLFVSVQRTDAGELAERHATSIVLNVGAAFVPPRPFRVSVFSGPPLLRTLHTNSADAAGGVRTPTLTGIYRVSSRASDKTIKVRVIRQSMLAGFDSAAVEAVQAASMIEGLLLPPIGEDSMVADIRFSSDSMAGARRLVSAKFPRIRLVDASPMMGNPPAVYPPAALPDSLSGEVVLRFIVGRDGLAIPGTAEVIRASSFDFLQAALEALARQRFKPATVGGCAVAQVVEYPFSFNAPLSAPRH